MNRLVRSSIIIASASLVVVLLLGTVLASNTKPEDVYRHFAVYTEVLSRIKSEYVEEPNMKNVTLGALNGLLESIDPYASYLSEEQYRQYEKEQKANEAGVGLMLSRKVGYVSVVDAIPGSPAAKAGLMTGDMIEAIGGVATRDMPLAYAELLLHGEPGSTVKLSVLRVRAGTDPQTIELARAKTAYPPVVAQMLDNKIGLVKVRSLEDGKTAEVAKAVKQLLHKKARKIILDLRRSSSGDPAEGLSLADLFVDHGELGYLVGQKVPRKDYEASPRKTITRLPMVVVINRGTARGAEVAAAALLANKRCPVVGERSYGDAAVRKVIRLADGGAVILSVAKYHTASGGAIQDKAVMPTVVSIAAEPPYDSQEGPAIAPRPEPSLADDTILQKAIEVLQSGGSGNSAANQQSPGSSAGEGLTPLGVPTRGPH